MSHAYQGSVRFLSSEASKKVSTRGVQSALPAGAPATPQTTIVPTNAAALRAGGEIQRKNLKRAGRAMDRSLRDFDP